MFRVDQWFGILASISIYDLVLSYDGTSGTLLLSTNCSRFQTLWELPFVNLLTRVGNRIQSLQWKGLGMTGLTWMVSALWFLSVWDPGKVIFKAETFWSNQWLLFLFFLSFFPILISGLSSFSLEWLQEDLTIINLETLYCYGLFYRFPENKRKLGEGKNLVFSKCLTLPVLHFLQGCSP